MIVQMRVTSTGGGFGLDCDEDDGRLCVVELPSCRGTRIGLVLRLKSLSGDRRLTSLGIRTRQSPVRRVT